ncbi:hypothetical protein B0T25DRAFT_616789 [Lasiosphaeria hispida]|uniref:Uncharacterized protein n=1 Tax=Lasiosphaeria hispida TaxID=260671 RepID=A0AAJ0H6D8_9PEZI|nr:hypothetical protein B0T25DRAFT_616789 [Lasiosphaeria hispida]
MDGLLAVEDDPGQSAASERAGILSDAEMAEVSSMLEKATEQMDKTREEIIADLAIGIPRPSSARSDGSTSSTLEWEAIKVALTIGGLQPSSPACSNRTTSSILEQQAQPEKTLDEVLSGIDPRPSETRAQRATQNRTADKQIEYDFLATSTPEHQAQLDQTLDGIFAESDSGPDLAASLSRSSQHQADASSERHHRPPAQPDSAWNHDYQPPAQPDRGWHYQHSAQARHYQPPTQTHDPWRPHQPPIQREDTQAHHYRPPAQPDYTGYHHYQSPAQPDNSLEHHYQPPSQPDDPWRLDPAPAQPNNTGEWGHQYQPPASP